MAGGGISTPDDEENLNPPKDENPPTEENGTVKQELDVYMQIISGNSATTSRTRGSFNVYHYRGDGSLWNFPNDVNYSATNGYSSNFNMGNVWLGANECAYSIDTTGTITGAGSFTYRYSDFWIAKCPTTYFWISAISAYPINHTYNISSAYGYGMFGMTNSSTGWSSLKTLEGSGSNCARYAYYNGSSMVITTSESTAQSSATSGFTGQKIYIVMRKRHKLKLYNQDGSLISENGNRYQEDGFDGISFTIDSYVPARTGYTFAGFSTSKSSSTISYKMGDSITLTSDKTLYAVYTPNIYGMSFNINGGTSQDGLVFYGGNDSGYGFTETSDGYFESQNKGVANSYSMTQLRFYAPSTTTVTFYVINYAESNYDYTLFSNIDASLTSSNTADTANVYRSFKGSSSENEQTVSYTMTSGYHYIWIKFRKDGSGNSYNDSVKFRIAMKSITYGSSTTYGTLPTPTREHYNFMGWYTTKDTGGELITSSTYVKAQHLILYARWELKTYSLTVRYYSQSASNSTYLSISAPNLSPTSASTGLNMSPAFSHTYTTSSYNVTISASNADPSKLISYYLRVGSSPTTTSYNGIDSFTYSWIPDSNDTINIYVKQQYRIYLVGNGSDTPASWGNITKIHGETVTIPVNNLTRTGYTANGWNPTSTLTTTPTYTTIYSANASATLYANWKANNYTVYFDENGGSAVSDKTVTYDSTYGTLPTPTRAGCNFGGWYTNENFTTQVTSSTIVKSAGNHTLYAKWIDNGANDLKYDDKYGYFYFEDGKYPQTYVGTALNNTLNSASVTNAGTLKYFNGKSDVTIPVYSYSGAEYAKLTASNTMTLALSGGSFTFTSGQTYWFKVEPIRWRVSAYGVSSTAYPSGWTSYGSSKTNFTVVSDRVLTVGAVTNQDTQEYWRWTDSELYATMKNNQNENIYNTNFGAVAEIEFDAFGKMGQQNKVEKAHQGLVLGFEKNFNGKDEFVKLGREFMYSDKITIKISAYMDNWADYSTKNMRMISCTQSGGWNIEPNGGVAGGNITFTMQDAGVGYKYIETDLTWASLGTKCWHTFMMTFNGQNFKAYIDGELIGTSANFSSGKVGYNSTNGIFIGAEAGDNLDNPAGNYFTGRIKEVYIWNGALENNETETPTIFKELGIRVASEADVKTNLSDMSAKASDMVKFLLGTSSEYIDYWTRDLVTLDNGKVITKIGEPMSRWLDRVSGVRFAMKMSEGVRVSQS